MPKKAIESAALALASMKKDVDEEMAEATIVKVQNYSENQRNTHATGGQEANASDEDEEGTDPRGG